MADTPDYLDDALALGDDNALKPNDDGVMPIMVTGARAKTSAEIEQRARAIENDLFHRLVPFQLEDGSLEWIPAQIEEMKAAGIDPELLELAMLQEQQESTP